MIDFHARYQTLIARPFMTDDTYVTVAPSHALRPYVRCFWGSRRRFNPHLSHIYGGMLLIPDTCYDLILIRNEQAQTFTMRFTGLNDSPSIDHWGEQDTDVAIFAIRFHFWTMPMLPKYPMTGTLNGFVDPRAMFPEAERFCEAIFDQPDFEGRMALAEGYIKALIELRPACDAFLNGVDFILHKHGASCVSQLSSRLCYSPRTVERIFLSTLGASPKKLADMVRYQSIWQRIVSTGQIDYPGLTFDYGYADQSHLIADFKKYHSMTPREALLALRPRQ